MADPGATLEITPRHLLAHTSGIARRPPDRHRLEPRRPGALRRRPCTRLGQIHAPDETYSFCNTGFGVAGRLIEVATGEHFDRVLRRRLVRPLGVPTRPSRCPSTCCCTGWRPATCRHRGGAARPSTRWPLTRSNGPMGGIVAPGRGGADLRPAAHRGGVGARRHRAAAGQRGRGDGRAAGGVARSPARTRRWAGRSAAGAALTCLGQDADTFGQRAFLRVVPERRFAAVRPDQQPARGGAGPRLLAAAGGRPARRATCRSPPSRARRRRRSRTPTPSVGTYRPAAPAGRR